MADLGGPVGTPRAQNGSRTGGSIPVPTNPEVRMRSPRQVMRDREAREALKKLQEEEQNRVRAERRSVQAAGVAGTAGEQSENRRSSRGYGTLQAQEAKAGGSIPKTNAPSIGQTHDTASARRQPQNQRPEVGTTSQARSRVTSQPQAQSRQQQAQAQTQRASSAQHTQQPQQTQSRAASDQPATARRQQEPSTTSQRPQAASASAAQTRTNNSSSFPHAFERWETLSSHWEGLTGFWIKRLEGNSEELAGQPLNHQLARQVTDLSAAGANLFHAVVELQRLRASSERKFQRWFFETRSEQEKTSERIAQLEADLAAARQQQSSQAPSSQAREEARQEAREEAQEEARQEAERLAAAEIEKIKRACVADLKEKDRELTISREEAKRGWEEIGRMEQENRDRTFSLRRGEPTVVGGVQVVPLLQGTTSRQTSTSRGHTGGLSSHPPGTEEPGYASYERAQSETDTDPFTESGRDLPMAPMAPMAPTSPPRQPPTSAAAIQSRTRATSASPGRPTTAGQPVSSTSQYADPMRTPTTSTFYQQGGPGTALHRGEVNYPGRGATDDRSYVPSDISEEDFERDEQGRVHRDQRGNPVVSPRQPPSEASDEYDVLEQLERERLLTQSYGGQYGQGTRYSATSNGGSYLQPDYSGQGYGNEWESVVQRHHHPSRLSDVLEEDERSRTSPSRASERSRGLR